MSTQKPKEFWIDRREHSGRRAQYNTGRHTAWAKRFQPNVFCEKFVEKVALDKAVDAIKEIKGRFEVPSASKLLEKETETTQLTVHGIAVKALRELGVEE